MSTLAPNFALYPDGTPANTTAAGSVGTVVNTVTSGRLRNSGFTTGQRGGTLFDKTNGATLHAVHGVLDMTAVNSAGSGLESPCGGAWLKYTQLTSTTFNGIRLDIKYYKVVNSFQMTIACAESGVIFYSNSWSTPSSYVVVAGDEIQFDVEFYLSGTTPKVKGRVWPTAAGQPGYLFDQVIGSAGHAINAVTGKAGLSDLANASLGVNTNWKSATFVGNFVLVPNTPTVTVSNIGANRAYGTSSAFSTDDASATHAYTKVRAVRISDSAVLAGPTTFSRPVLIGPHEVTGLPYGPAGPRWEPIVDPDFRLEMLHGDSNGNESGWGVSSPFQTLSLWESQYFSTHKRLRVANGSGTLIDLSGRLVGGNYEWPNPNAPIAGLSFELLRELTNGYSLSPLVQTSPYNKLDDGVTYSPLILVGRLVVLDVALTAVGAARPADGSSEWIEMFRGHITRKAWPSREGRILPVTCSDQSGFLQVAKSEAEYTYAAGTALEDVVRAILDNNGFSSVTLDMPATGKVIPSDYTPGRQKSPWEQIWAAVQSVGCLIWYEYSNATTLALTYVIPERDKVVPDLTMPLYDFEELEVDEEEIRNVGYLVLTDENGERQEIGPVDDAASIATYGGVRRPFWIVLEEDSPVRSVADGTALLDDAVADCADPDMVSSASVPFTPFLRNARDLYRYAALLPFFDSDQLLAPFAATWGFKVDEEDTMVIQQRGRPSAGARTWTGRYPGSISPDVTDNGITHSPTGRLNIAPVFNSVVTRWRAWDKVGSSPKASGVPDDNFAMTPLNLREVETAAWSVRDGDHYVLVRAFDADGNFRDREEVFAVSGVGGGGSSGGGGTAPTDIPGTAFLTLGAVIGGTQEITAEWANTNSTVGLQGQWQEDGVDGAWFDMSPGDTTSTDTPTIGVHRRFRSRYTQGVGLEGTPSTWSARMYVSGAV